LPILRAALTDKIVAKKTKTETSNGTETSTPSKPVRRAKAPSTRRRSATKSTSGPRKAKTGGGSTHAPQLSDEEIRLRAYFIAERRHRFDLPGDADSDWLEAKRQLLSEQGQK
jgi:hypothetical protein